MIAPSTAVAIHHAMITSERLVANVALVGSRIDINISTDDEASQMETTV